MKIFIIILFFIIFFLLTITLQLDIRKIAIYNKKIKFNIMNKVCKYATSCVSIGMFMATICLFQGCNSDFEDILETKNESAVIGEYLDCPSDLSPKEELLVIEQAFQRIGDHFVIEDDTCYMTVQSA